MADWRPDASLETLRIRAQWLHHIREFFRQHNVLEVETPVLSPASIPDPHIDSLQTRFAGQTLYLQTSPEFFMKRLLAAGSGDIWQLARVFRDGELGRLHNPEFTMIEWYRLGFSLEQLMQEVAGLIRALCPPDGFTPPQFTSYQQLFIDHLGLDPLQEDHAVFHHLCREQGWHIPDGGFADWQSAMDWLLGMQIEPAMRGLVFVHGYPATQAALARISPDDARVARRFELFIDGIEIANGFEELTDAKEQRRRFEDENRRRRENGQAEVPLDESLLAALEAGLPECAGVALGLDRLLMWALGDEQLRDVMGFGVDAGHQ